MSIIDITPRLPRVECQRSVIAHLEGALERARAGETIEIAVVETTPDGSTRTYWSKLENVNILLGGLSRLTHKIIAHMEAKTA